MVCLGHHWISGRWRYDQSEWSLDVIMKLVFLCVVICYIHEEYKIEYISTDPLIQVYNVRMNERHGWGGENPTLRMNTDSGVFLTLKVLAITYCQRDTSWLVGKPTVHAFDCCMKAQPTVGSTSPRQVVLCGIRRRLSKLREQARKQPLHGLCFSSGLLVSALTSSSGFH